MKDDPRRLSFDNVQTHLSGILRARSNTDRTHLELVQQPVEDEYEPCDGSADNLPFAWNKRYSPFKKAS